ncbi:hypothetical protein ACO0LO_23285 [Undibacterium sp. TJN25]|uniref:hypothetical protein n=1 Tax=Undibacterium sp. TJN25 TaxID=3413056 RepID=UPI003BF031E5
MIEWPVREMIAGGTRWFNQCIKAIYMLTRFAFSIFSDDVRHEVGNKSSIMGIYGPNIIFSKFPAILDKLCITTTVHCDVGSPVLSLKIEVGFQYSTLQEFVAPRDFLDRTHNLFAISRAQTGKGTQCYYNIQSFIAPFNIVGPGQLTVKAVLDDLEYEAGQINILLETKG